MKAQQAPAPFAPVNLTLETQDEVNAIFAVLNHVELAKALGLDYRCYETLNPFRTTDYTVQYKAICDLF